MTIILTTGDYFGSKGICQSYIKKFQEETESLLKFI